MCEISSYLVWNILQENTVTEEFSGSKIVGDVQILLITSPFFPSIINFINIKRLWKDSFFKVAKGFLYGYKSIYDCFLFKYS